MSFYGSFVGNLGFKGSRGRVSRSVEVANASLSYRLMLGHDAVLEHVRIAVDRVDDIVVFWPKAASRCLQLYACS